MYLEKSEASDTKCPWCFSASSHPFRGVGQLQLCNIILTWADSEDANETDIHYFWLIGIITCPKMLHSTYLSSVLLCGPRPRFLMNRNHSQQDHKCTRTPWFLLINWSKQLSPYHLWTTTIKASCFTTTTNNPPITVEYCIHVQHHPLSTKKTNSSCS